MKHLSAVSFLPQMSIQNDCVFLAHLTFFIWTAQGLAAAMRAMPIAGVRGVQRSEWRTNQAQPSKVLEPSQRSKSSEILWSIASSIVRAQSPRTGSATQDAKGSLKLVRCASSEPPQELGKMRERTAPLNRFDPP